MKNKLSSNSKAELKFQKIMSEFAHDKLTSHGTKVTDQKQALAIAFSEARKVNPDYGMKKEGSTLSVEDFYNKKSKPKGEKKFGVYSYPKKIYVFQGKQEIEQYPYSDSEERDRIVQKLKEKGIKQFFPFQYEDGGKLEEIYSKGTSRQLWDAWDKKQRSHFLIDHADMFLSEMGDDFNEAANRISKLKYSDLPLEIRKEIAIHHAMGLYAKGGNIEKFWNATKKHTTSAFNKSKELAGKGYKKAKEYTDKKIHDQKRNIALDVLDETRGNSNTKDDSRILNEAANLVEDQYSYGGGINKKLSPMKKKLQHRIDVLTKTMHNASASAQKSIQKKIDKLQKKFDYNPSVKQRAMDNKGKFAVDVPAKYSKAIYRKLWSMNILPKIHTLNGTSSIVVSSKNNLDKAYQVYSDILKEHKEKVPVLSLISRKL